MDYRKAALGLGACWGLVAACSLNTPRLTERSDAGAGAAGYAGAAGNDASVGGSGAGDSGRADRDASRDTGTDGDFDAGPFVEIELTAGGSHTCARFGSGTARCWGRNEEGQLGYGNRTQIGDDEPAASAANLQLGAAVKQIAAGDVHTCAVLMNAAVTCWGAGYQGRTGYARFDNIGDDELPASVGHVQVGGEVQRIAVGGAHTCAQLTSGALRCWGDGDYGKLGYGNTADVGASDTPASVGDVNVGGNVREVAVGSAHTCALLTGGAVRCWGRAESGQLGYGSTEMIGDNEAPASAGNVDVGGTVKQITAGGSHTCALLTSGTVRCWGSGEHGALGYGDPYNVGDNETPASVGDVPVGGVVSQIVAGLQHTCALLTTGAVRCWGAGGDGRLGYGNSENVGDSETPASVGDVHLGGAARQLTVGSHTCAQLTSGPVYCWGHGSSGKLGYGNTNNVGDNETPVTAGRVLLF